MKKVKMPKDRLVKELVSLVDKDECILQLRSRSPYKVGDFLVDILREACLRSSLHSFNQTVYYFDGIKYSSIDNTTFKNVVYESLRAIGLPEGNFGRLYYMNEICRNAAMEKPLHPDPAVVTFSNCAFDMDGKVSRKFSAKWVSVSKMDYAYDENADCLHWQAFLDEVLPDKKMQMLLQEFLGCVFIDRKKAKLEKMLVLLGPGANGKSVVHDVVRGLLGEENVTAFGLGELTQGYELKKNIATINGKRLNYASEISAQSFLKVNDQLKKLISGEPMAARANYGQNFTASDIPLIMANANRLPPMKSEDIKAMSRRFIVLPFNVEIPVDRQNPLLSRELKKELPGIFNWVMKGRERYIANGFVFSGGNISEEVASGYRMEANTVVQFMLAKGYDVSRRDSMEQPKWFQTSDLYTEYNEWCLKKGKSLDSIENHIRFGQILSNDMGYRRRTINKKTHYAVYTDNAKMAYVPDSDKNLEKKNLDNKPFLDLTGVKWIRSKSGLCKELNLSEGIIRECYERGVLSNSMRKEGRFNYYNISECRKAVAEYLKAKEDEKKNRSDATEDKEIWIKRGSFNKLMEKYGEPYRKYGTKFRDRIENGSGFILVPDDWDYLKEIPVEKQSPKVKRRNRYQIQEINIENY